MEGGIALKSLRASREPESTLQEVDSNREYLSEVIETNPDLQLLQKFIGLPKLPGYDVKTISMEIPLFSSEKEVGNFCVAVLILVESYSNLTDISICTNCSETPEEDAIENYRNEAFVYLTQAILRLRPCLLFTDCLNCSNDIKERSIRLMSTKNLKTKLPISNFSDLRFQRGIADVLPKLSRCG